MFDTNDKTAGKPSIVLVHGAWADSSCWNDVIRPLQADGYPVYAPPNPLRSLAGDAASVASFLKAIPGPVILVGHSYGGAVISVASAGRDNVKALVYIDAFVPDAEESCLELLGRYPAPPSDLFTPVQLDSGETDLYFSPKYFGGAFATGVDANISTLLAVTQRPVTAGALGEKAPAELGWKSRPNWYVLGGQDQAIPPPLKQMMAERAKATITRVNAGHLSMLQHPETTIAAIVAACEGAALVRS
jgi:pimeloyl-ACP methyl ester carboxylesterase